MNCHEVEARLGAFLDGELSVTEGVAVRAHLETCAACKALAERHRALSEGVRAAWPADPAPDALRTHVRQAVRDAGSAPPPWRALPRWLAVAASVALVVAGTWKLTWDRAATGALTEELLAAHLRSLMPGRLTDVASTDQHTVKPWFDGRLDFSPPVADEADRGYPLVGGRLDYVAGRSVAALVYGRRLHRINVFVWPASGESGVARAERNGYHMEHWTAGGMTFWAVSDLNLPELDELVRLLRSPAPASGASPPSGPPGP